MENGGVSRCRIGTTREHITHTHKCELNSASYKKSFWRREAGESNYGYIALKIFIGHTQRQYNLLGDGIGVVSNDRHSL